MLSSLSATGIGVLMLVLFGVFYWLSIFATVRAILAFVGTCLIGTVGFLGGALHAIAIWISNLAASRDRVGVRRPGRRPRPRRHHRRHLHPRPDRRRRPQASAPAGPVSPSPPC